MRTMSTKIRHHIYETKYLGARRSLPSGPQRESGRGRTPSIGAHLALALQKPRPVARVPHNVMRQNPGRKSRPAPGKHRQAATALRAQAHELATKTERLEALVSLSRSVTATLEPQQVLDSVVAATVRLLGVNLARVWLWDEGTQALRHGATAGDPDLTPYPRHVFRSGEGFVGLAFEKRETLVTASAATDPRYLLKEWVRETGIHAIAAIPLLVGDRALGVLTGVRRAPEPFQAEEVSLLSSFAAHAAIAITNARLFRETQIRAEKLRALAALSRMVTASLDPTQVFDFVIQASTDLLDVPVASLWTAEGEELHLQAERRLQSDRRIHRRFRVGEGVVGWIAAHKEAVVISEFASDPRVKNKEWARAEGLHAFAGVPLLVERRCVGVLAVLRTTSQPFAAEEVELLTAFAAQAALTLENAKLYEQVKRYAKELEQKVEERTQELREAQEELVRKEKLAILGQLAGGVGHELRNPLGVLKNSIYYLKLRLQDTDEKVQRHLSIMEREIGLANKITTDLLDFSRIKAPATVATDLNDLIQEILAQYLVDGHIVVRTALNQLPSVMIDKDQIRQVFLNLIMNAVQAMPEGGELTIVTDVDPDCVVASFADTGCGIPEENLGKIFQPLFTTKAKGLGLGLAVSRNLLEANKGRITVNSQVGQGTTFTVRFPMP